MQFHCPGSSGATSAAHMRTVGLLGWLEVPLVLNGPKSPCTLQSVAAILAWTALKQLTSAVKDYIKCYTVILQSKTIFRKLTLLFRSLLLLFVFRPVSHLPTLLPSSPFPFPNISH